LITCGYKCIKYNWPVKLSTFIATIYLKTLLIIIKREPTINVYVS
jgi:hypothetical protein